MALETKRCYFTFGRYQPPTIGHKANFDSVKTTAGTDDYRIYLSQSHDAKGNNPLPPDRKLFYMNKMFQSHKGKFFSGPRDPVKILQHIMMDGYDEVIMLVGSDRVSAMQFLHKYNGKDFTFRKIQILSSGSRDADGDTFTISGTKMRRAAHANDFTSFRKGIPSSLSDRDAKSLMSEIAMALPSNFK
tara:strand:+ start:29 stop:592 length:564 start_codon:yes stop_codon:yes gene_type:complete